ncbi:MAG TPA: hypothetical protein VE522_01615 [Actinomycetota bacterium]|nr:hypothetical protein [Actinomycetota bacterium]
MIDQRERFERAFELFDMPEPAMARLVARRQRKERKRRVGTAVVALAVAAAAFGGLARAFLSGPETTPADQPSRRFVGTWTSTELFYDESSQTMTIRPAEDGALDITLHDDSSALCSDRQTRVDRVDTPSTMMGRGRLEDATTLVVPSPVLACVGVNGREKPAEHFGYPEEKGGTSYTLVLDLGTDRLFDNLGVAWHRGATPESGADTTTIGSERTGPGTYSMLGGEVTFHAPEGRPWNDHIEAYIDPRLFFLEGPEDPDEVPLGQSPTMSIAILVNPLPEASCAAPPGVPASAAAVVQSIRSNPDLEATEPVAERVGGIDALRLDVAAAPGASTCPAGSGPRSVPVVSVSGRGDAWGLIDRGELGRLYVLDLPGGSARALVIMITAPEAAFEQAVQAAAPVVDSFEFHTGQWHGRPG